MKLILTEDVPSLGSIGAIVNVKDGYARNYLLPRGIAVPANESNTKQLVPGVVILSSRRCFLSLFNQPRQCRNCNLDVSDFLSP